MIKSTILEYFEEPLDIVFVRYAGKVYIVPASAVTEDHQNIAYYINQFSIFTLYKIEQI